MVTVIIMNIVQISRYYSTTFGIEKNLLQNNHHSPGFNPDAHETARAQIELTVPRRERLLADIMESFSRDPHSLRFPLSLAFSGLRESMRNGEADQKGVKRRLIERG